MGVDLASRIFTIGWLTEGSLIFRVSTQFCTCHSMWCLLPICSRNTESSGDGFRFCFVRLYDESCPPSSRVCLPAKELSLIQGGHICLSSLIVQYKVGPVQQLPFTYQRERSERLPEVSSFQRKGLPRGASWWEFGAHCIYIMSGQQTVLGGLQDRGGGCMRWPPLSTWLVALTGGKVEEMSIYACKCFTVWEVVPALPQRTSSRVLPASWRPPECILNSDACLLDSFVSYFCL